MNFMAFHMDGGKRSCRAEVLTCTASDASFLVHYRYSERLVIVRILSYHTDCTDRTVTCAVTTAYFVCVDYTAAEIYYSMSDLDR